MPHRFFYGRLKRWFIYRVLHVDDTPHRIALGVAVGIFVCWLPCMPVQMILTVALSTLVGANKFVGVPFVWISNPLTIFPVYWPSWMLGKWILRERIRRLRQGLQVERRLHRGRPVLVDGDLADLLAAVDRFPDSRRLPRRSHLLRPIPRRCCLPPIPPTPPRPPGRGPRQLIAGLKPPRRAMTAHALGTPDMRSTRCTHRSSSKCRAFRAAGRSPRSDRRASGSATS